MTARYRARHNMSEKCRPGTPFGFCKPESFFREDKTLSVMNYNMMNAVRIFCLLACPLLLADCNARQGAEGAQGAAYDQVGALPVGLSALPERELAMAVCGNCHLFPEPQLLPKAAWQRGVLPHMALRLGVVQEGLQPYGELRDEEIVPVMQAGIFPDKPLVDSAAWAKITTYYLREAPAEALPSDRREAVPLDLSLFRAVEVRFDGNRPPLTTLLRFDPRTGHLWVGDGEGTLRRLDGALRVADSLRIGSPAADLVLLPDGEALLVLMGVMPPNDLDSGRVVRLATRGTLAIRDTLLQKLVRPVHAAVADLDGDGAPDVAVCNHGNYTGSLAWYKDLRAPREGGTLRAGPGFRKVTVRDLNRDGRPDLVALAGQGNEGIWAFYNRGAGRFEAKPLLRFPPVYGSSYFQLADFNGDGLEDILYTNGDNADYSITPKKYHGLRIFLNRGNDAYEESWFFPLHGATQADARDFDGDGDLDLAAIAFFPRYGEAPEEGFVYFENTGNLHFAPHSLPNAARGRWLVMETGDFDGDADPDIALGSYLFSPGEVPLPMLHTWREQGASVTILYNTRRDRHAKSPAQ